MLHRIQHIPSIALLLPLLVVMAACQSGAPDAVAKDAQTYGETDGIGNAVAAADVAEAPGDHLDQPVTVAGRVTQVCQRKGCWLVLDTGGAPIRVHVARTDAGDYAFTVPTDLSDARATVRGTLQRVTLDAATQRHMADDADTDAAAELQPATELQIIASGIIITPSRT
ncbi:MAG: DUF4920 domain-containing protein [Bacteroidetes bacterium]|jgi:hypothetical protein|nr:DUF4920 domain-containing protein [Bacteroidota bacterium]